MSVINNVLKQLDDRPSQFEPLKLSKNNEARRLGGSPPLFWIVFIAVSGLAIYAAYQYFQQSELTEHSARVLSMMPTGKVADKQVEEMPAPEVIIEIPVVQTEEHVQAITGLQINETVNALDLSLQLEAGAQSYLREQSGNRYIFQISHSRKKIIAPDIKDHALLKHIDIRQNLTGTEIQIDTVDNVLVETNGKIQGDSYDWLIRLKKVPEPETRQVAVVEQPKRENQPEQKAVVKAHSDNAASKKQASPAVRLKINPVTPELSDENKYSKAMLALQQGAWSQAQRQLKNLIGSRVDKKARKSLLGIYQNRSLTAAMQALLQQSLQRYPQDPDFKLMDAGQLFSAEQFAQLIEKYQSAGSDYKIINLVAAALQSQGNHATAINAYRRSLELNANQPRIRIRQAISFEQQKQFSLALKAYQSVQGSSALNQRLQQFVRERITQLSKAG